MEFVTNGTSDMCVFGLGLNFEELTRKIKKKYPFYEICRIQAIVFTR